MGRMMPSSKLTAKWPLRSSCSDFDGELLEAVSSVLESSSCFSFNGESLELLEFSSSILDPASCFSFNGELLELFWGADA